MRQRPSFLPGIFRLLFVVVLILNTTFPVRAEEKKPVVNPSMSPSTDISQGLTLGTESRSEVTNEIIPVLSEEIERKAQTDVEAKPVRLELAAEPAIYIDKKPIIIKWELSNLPNSETSNYKIVARPPDGVLPVNKTDVPETDGSLIILPKSNNGVVVWKVLDYAEFPLVFNYELVSGEKVQDFNSVIINKPQVSISTNQRVAQADIASSEANGKVRVELPIAVARSPLVMDIRYPSPNALRGNSLTWNPVEIIAVDVNTQKNVTKFSTPIKISINYDETKIFNWDERDLTIFYYDPQINDWFPIETTVDTETNTLTAQSDHLTVFDYKANNWQSTMLPTVDAFKTADFTGASTYQINMWTPPAPGGLQPTVNLSYNSQIIDEASAYKQASWAGMGWDMDTGAITRNMHGTDVDISDDTYYISVGGVSGQLIPIGSNPNNGNIVYYNTADQAFMKVESHDYSPSDPDAYSFIAWTKDGTRYDFKETIDVRKNSNNCNSITWRWSLSKVTDIHGNTLDYSYYTELKNDGCNSEIAVYPETITYGNGKYRVNFVRGVRTDYQVSWANSGTNALYGTKRLNEVQIQHNAGTGWTNVRRYVLSYAPNTETVNIIYPNFAFSNGGKTLTLVGIQEFGADESALPAITFTYGDNLHLTSVNNGQGGVVTMTYTPWSYLDHINDDIRKIDVDFTTADCSGGAGPSPVWSQVFGTVRCDGTTKRLQVGTTTSVNSRAERAVPENLLKPSARYWYKVNVNNINAGNVTAYWGLTDGTQTNMANAIVNDNSTYNDQVQEFTMGVNYNPATTRLRFECSSCFYRTFEFIQYVTYYRVASRTVTIQPNGLVSTYTYKYDNGAPISTDNSAAAAAAGSNVNLLYVSKTLGEYRGNAMSMMTNPQGLTTVNWFWQADGLKGRNYEALTLERTFFDDLESLNSNWTASGGTHVPTAVYEIDFDNSIKSVNGTFSRNTSLGNNKVAVAHIRLSGTGATGQVGLVGGPVITLTNGSSSVNGTPLLSGGNFKLDEWYAVMFFTDSVNGNRARIWQLDNPNNFAEATVGNGSGAFYSSVSNGTIYTDSYFEGVPYSESINRYEGISQYDTTTGNSIPDIPNSILMGFKDLGITWVRTNSVENRNYNGDAAFVGTRQDFTYETLYGNILSQIESGNDGTGWIAYRKTENEYYPNATTYVVSAPARQTLKSANDTLMAETLYFYDNASAYSTPPTKGDLTTQRTWAGGTNYAQTSFVYDVFGNQTAQTSYTSYATAVTNPPAIAAQTTTTGYDTSGYNTYPVVVTNALQHVVTTGYNYALGVPNSVQDANLVTTTATYDGFGRIKTITAPGDASPTLSITYWDARIPYQVDLVQTVSATSSIRISHFYDGAGREIQSQTANSVVSGSLQNVVVDTQYNVLGQAIKKTVPYIVNANISPSFVSQTFSQFYTATTYDIIGRVLTTITPNQTGVTYSYKDLSTIIYDPQNNPTETFVDVWGRTKKVVPPTGPFVEYTYDLQNRLTDTDRAENNTHIEYDVLGRKLNMRDPDMGYWTYEYDALGNLIRQVDAKNQTACLYYDALNRLDGKVYSTVVNYSCGSPSNFTVDYNYDEATSTNGKGRRTSMTDLLSGAAVWNYDSRGRLLTETKTITGAANSFITSWIYNSGDLPVLMTYPDGETITYAYNTDGTLKQVTSNTTGDVYLNDMQYDEAGRLKLIEYGNNIIDKTFNYFSWNTATMGGLLQGTLSVAGVTNIQNLSYTYDQNGNVLNISDVLTGEAQVFGYDALNRITSASASGSSNGAYSESYSYNPTTGNLANNGVSTLLYNDFAHVHAVTNAGSNSYTYDANGNMQTRNTSGGSYTLVYDEENRITSVMMGVTFDTSLQSVAYNGSSSSMHFLARPALQVGSTATPTATPTGFIFADGFEAGDLSAWNNFATDGGDLSVTSQAAAIGNYGMQVLIDDTTAIAVSDQIPTSQSHYSTRFYFDPNSVNIPNGDGLYLVAADTATNGWAFCLGLDRVGDGYQLDPCVIDDTNTWRSGEGTYIADGWQAIELEWLAASAPGANDGYLKLWVNDVLVETLANLDTDTLPITDIDFGAVSDVPAGSSGTMYFDGFVSKQGEHIGLDPNGPMLNGPLTNLLYIDGFESGNLNGWGNITTDGGDLSVTSQSAAVGNYGMQALIDDTVDIGVYNYSSISESHYSTRFYFDPNTVNLPEDESIYILAASAYPNGWAFTLELKNRSGNYTITPVVVDDTDAWILGDEINIIDGWQAIELEWQAASAPDANDGYLKFWNNDVLVNTLSNLDTDTLAITDANFGVDFGTSLPLSVSGTLYFDEIVSMKGQHIGLDPNGPTLPNSGTINIASFDDAEENTAGVVNIYSSDLELVRDSDNQQVGVRFTGVNIPQGATILNAYIQFTVDETNSETTNLSIQGEAVDHSAALSTTQISVRSRTTASVAWSPVPWLTLNQSGTDQRTPSLIPIVQELVNRSGWNPGQAMTFIITGTGKRVAISEDGAVTSSTAPRLVVNYSMTPSNTPTPSLTPTATSTFTPTPTNTSIPTSTATPTVYTLVLQPNGTDGVDTNIVSTSATTNYGTSADMGIGENNDATNKYARSLIKFNLSSLPANATITSAILSLWTSSDVSSNDRTIQVYRLKVPFIEGQATWNRSTTSTNWQTAGASGVNDRESSAIGSILILNNEPLNTEKQIALNIAKIQEFVTGSFTNNGFILVADTELNDRFNYKTSDTTTAIQRPKLVIQYIVGGPTPTSVNTSTSTATATWTNTPTSTATRTNTPTATSTHTNTPAGPTSTFTATATRTNTPTVTATRTNTPSQSSTSTLTPINTSTATITQTPSVPVFSNAQFVYDGDGKRVRSIITMNIGQITTFFVGNHYEVTGSTVTKYYYAGTQRIAMRKAGTLYFVIGDHLNSTSIITDANGVVVSETRYKAWGQVRYTSGTTPMNYTYTGQYSYVQDFGLMYYNARWYDPYLNHFTQPDTIVPNLYNPQDWDRYSYARNNPIRYNDPSGHDPAGTSCYLRGYCDNPNDTWKAAKNLSSPKPFRGYVFIFSCGQRTDCTNKRTEPNYKNQVPLQPLRERVEFLGGTTIYLGDQESLENKLTYAEKVKSTILDNSSAQGVFLIGHSFGTGANTIAAYDLITERSSPLNLKGQVILDSYLLTGDGSGIDLGSNKNPKDYDTQYKAEVVANLVPLFVAHSPENQDKTYFPFNEFGNEYGTNHYTLANDNGMTNAAIDFFLSLVP